MNSNNNLDKYFIQAKKAENPQSFFSDDEIRSITENGYHGVSANPINNVLNTIKRNKIMTGTSLIIVGSILWFSLTGGEDAVQKSAERSQEIAEGNKTINNYELLITNEGKENKQSKNNEKHLIANNDEVKTHVIDSKEEIVEPNNKWISLFEKVKRDSIKGLDIEVWKKVRYELIQYIMKYDPPSQDILTYENNPSKFDALLKKSIEKASGNINDAGKLRLYGYICRLFAYDIQGIEEIELSDEELKEAGVKNDGNCLYVLRDVKYDPNDDNRPESMYRDDNENIDYKKVEVFGPSNDILDENGYDTTITGGYYKNKIRMYKNLYGEQLFKYDGWDVNTYEKVQPVALYGYSSGWYKPEGEETLKYGSNKFLNVFKYSPILDMPDSLYYNYEWSDRVFNTQVSKLVPIKIKVGEDEKNDSTSQFREFTLWYVLSEDLIAVMPERYRESLRKELELITGIEEGTIGAEEACDAIKGKESYLDLCRYESDAIKDLKVYPNPNSTKEVKLQFKLSKRCSIRIDMHDLSGKLISNIGNLPCVPGEQNLTFEYRKFIPSQGVYLISITTSTGEQVVRRFIVE